jgi:hypothetical protein
MVRRLLDVGARSAPRPRRRLAVHAAAVLAAAAGLTLALAGCTDGGEAGPAADPPSSPPSVAPDVVERASRLQPLTLPAGPLRVGLLVWERAVLDKLEQAAGYIDAAYWQQVDPGGQALLASLDDATVEPQRSLRLMLAANYGVWDRFDAFVPFVGGRSRPAGGYVYPPDLTREELDTYMAAHPQERRRLLDPYTVVRREGDRLVSVPYHEAYAEWVEPAARLLDEAAALSKNASLARYLRREARALRTDDYYEANLAWLDVDARLDVSIGPHETYDDSLTGQKRFYKANVLLVDRAASARLEAFAAAVPALQRSLPVPPALRPDQTGTLTPIELADDVRRAGQARAVMEGVAFSLPNDPRVWKAKGAKKVMMRNFLRARYETVLQPLTAVILAPATLSALEFDGYVTWGLLHEIAHTLGPATVKRDDGRVTVREALGEWYLPIEEGKADIAGLYAVPILREQGVIEASAASHYVGFLAESLRSIRFGQASAYGVIRLVTWNYLLEAGALTLDPGSQRYRLDVSRMTPAVERLLAQLLTIEGEGDAAAAQAFIARYGALSPELQALLEGPAEAVPLEFVPMYPES